MSVRKDASIRALVMVKNLDASAFLSSHAELALVSYFLLQLNNSPFRTFSKTSIFSAAVMGFAFFLSVDREGRFVGAVKVSTLSSSAMRHKGPYHYVLSTMGVQISTR